MMPCRCGEEVDDWARFHFAPPFEENAGTEMAGHYVLGPSLTSDPDERGSEPLEGWPPNLRRMAELGFFGDPPKRAPRPGPVPSRISWLREDALRATCLDYLDTFGYEVHDFEQGYRSDGSSRVSLGVGDAYIQGYGIRAWIEFKRWDNELTADQQSFGSNELRSGGIYLVIYELSQLTSWHDHTTHTRRENP